MAQEEKSRIRIGSSVELAGPEGETIVQLVSQAEVDLEAGKISIESPLAQALLGRRAGEEVIVQTPTGQLTFRILRVVEAVQGIPT
jgi:transcription elongation GreA/GreB family factor